ncbi:hypothetical protein [Flavobacterium quisquiliarum]|uniref:Lipoprotein n=1 Tax=Flavobacterium quisquiliarum TaxID=1834436 RepID=A0ABV8W126_9FLAO|nr:hypothetical protein [Flavobacterium quisquiliarum]MBW1654677.1 hypothetical protein [Flavobacterium quisquiliarum]NWL01638.1 hypothetical protein [Flavobacterium collinsii]
MKHCLICTLFLTLFISCKQEAPKQTKVPKKHTEKTEVKKPIPISAEEFNLLKKLMTDEYEIYKANEGTRMDLREYPFALSITDEAESRSTIYYSILAKDDFNNDGITDYVVSESSDSMAGSRFVFVIMKDKRNIEEQHDVLEYAPFSYNNLDETKYNSKKITTVATKNWRTYDVTEDENNESANLVFSYQNGNLYEESYLTKCKLAKLESKTIFNSIPNISRRERSIDIHNYTETISETYKVKDTLIHADLSGCDNPLFEFEFTIPVAKEQLSNPDFFKHQVVSALTFLAKNTQFSNDINPIIAYYEENEITEEQTTIDHNLLFNVFARKEDYNRKKKTFSIRINIERRYNAHQAENWEIATRRR